MFCPDCGLQNRDGAKFCATCGRSLKDLPAYKPVPKKKRKTKKKAAGKSQSNTPVKRTTPPQTSTPPPPPPQIQITTTPPLMTSSGLLKVGTIIDRRYEVTSHIATGGMGAIYKAEDTRLKTVVVIKEMLDFFHSHDERKYAIQRFREEALLLADLRHPNVPRVTDNFIENNRYYLIMDFVEGKNTDRLLRDNRGYGLPEDRIVRWAVQVCDVLDYLHTRVPPIIYRDMKPSNIMICDNDHVMLVDFGIARHFTPRRPGTMIGTQGYAPPEQYKGNTEPRSDLYALAATLHNLLSANDPTQGVPFNFKPIRYWRKDVSADMERILSKALNNRVELRYANAAEMKKEFVALEKKLESSPRHSSSPPSRPSASRVARTAGKPMRPHIIHNSRQKSSIDAQNYFVRGKNYTEAGDLRRAKRELEKAIKLSPDYPEAHSLLGYILARQGRTVDAAKHLRKATAGASASATAHLYIGKAYARMGRIADSQKEYEIAKRLDPNIFSKKNQGFLEKLIRSLLP
ncbi:MAG: protein kinase [Candidatus Eremiobacteraeota bacterium]|nr:protein kinase [Candidatus Eremiobacteraeota bacterium]